MKRNNKSSFLFIATSLILSGCSLLSSNDFVSKDKGFISNGINESISSGTPIRGTSVEEKTNKQISEVSIQNDVISGYLACDDLKSQYEYLAATDKGGGNPAKDYQSYPISWDKVEGVDVYTIRLCLGETFDENNYVQDSVATNSYENGFYVPGKTYTLRIYGSDLNNYLKEISFKVKDNELRYINVDGGQNIRDLGGWKTYNGEHVNYELLYRGANLNGSYFIADNGSFVANGCGSGKLTEKGKAQMNALGFQTEIDLRTPLKEEIKNEMIHNGTPRPSGSGDDGGQWLTGTGWNDSLENYIQADMNGLMYEHVAGDSFMAAYKSSLQTIFDRLARRENYPVYFHCNAGADRTGTFGFIFNGLLGVQYNDLTKDYQLTSYSNGGGRRWRNKGNGERFYKISEIDESQTFGKPGWQFDSYNTWDLLVRRMLTRYGFESYIAKLGTADEGDILSTVITKWLLEEGVTQNQINAFKDIMLNKEDYSSIKDQEFVVTLNNVPGVNSLIVHGGETLHIPSIDRKGYILTGFKDENGNDYNIYQPITKDITLTASYKAYTDDLGQENATLIDWTSKLAKACIENNKDYKRQGCSASYDSGIAAFMPRNPECLDTTVDMPLICYKDYSLVSFYTTSVWVQASLYIDNYYLGVVPAASLANAKKFNITIMDGTVYVNGVYAYLLTNKQNNGEEPLRIRYVMDTYKSSCVLGVSDFETKVVDYVKMAKSYAESLDNTVLGGFNNVKSLLGSVNAFLKYYGLCNEYEKELVSPSEKVFSIVNMVQGATNKVTYRIWNKVSSVEYLLQEDILKAPLSNPEHAPFEFAYWGNENGAYQGFNSTISSDLTLDAYYEYTSRKTNTKQISKMIYQLTYYCFPSFSGYYGENEVVEEPSSPTLPSGYTFLYWTKDATSMEQYSFHGVLDDDTTLYAVIKDKDNNQTIYKNVHTVTYKDAYGIGNDKVVSVFEGEKVAEIDGPTSSSYEFAYWAYNGEKFDFSSPIYEDIVLAPYYWKNVNEVTENSYIVLSVTSDAYKTIGDDNQNGWNYNSSSGAYIANLSSYVEFGMRNPGQSVYTVNLPKLNFSEYGCVTFNVKNGWEYASMKMNGISVSDSLIPSSKVLTFMIQGTSLYVNNQLLDSALDNDILIGKAFLQLEVTDSQNGYGKGCFDLYDYLAYRTASAL